MIRPLALWFIGMYCLLPAMTTAATAQLLIDGAQTVSAGERFTVTVRAAAPGEPINAVSGVVTFPAALKAVSVSTNESAINFWIQQPVIEQTRVHFEGIILSPGYQGTGATLFKIVFEALRAGDATIGFSEGAVLAHDGKGTNVLATLANATVRIAGPSTAFVTPEGAITAGIFSPAVERFLALPVITEVPRQILSGEPLVLRGKGEPGALTKILFQDTSTRSLGERFVNLLQTKKQKLSEVFVKNKEDGTFEYIAPAELIAGAYSATPFLVDAEAGIEKPGLGTKVFVSDSKPVRFLVILINVLALLVPVVALIVVIYFIPWYSWRRMRLLRRQLGFEERKILFSEHQIERADKIREHQAVKDSNS